MSEDYQTYLDDLLVAVADQQSGSEIQSVNLQIIHDKQFRNCPPTWLDTAATEMLRCGYGVDWQDSANRSFRINGAGLKHAQFIRNNRKTKTFFDHVRAIPRSDWIAFVALIVSAIALFK